jgi:hypothetical protein
LAWSQWPTMRRPIPPSVTLRPSKDFYHKISYYRIA